MNMGDACHTVGAVIYDISIIFALPRKSACQPTTDRAPSRQLLAGDAYQARSALEDISFLKLNAAR